MDCDSFYALIVREPRIRARKYVTTPKSWLLPLGCQGGSFPPTHASTAARTQSSYLVSRPQPAARPAHPPAPTPQKQSPPELAMSAGGLAGRAANPFDGQGWQPKRAAPSPAWPDRPNHAVGGMTIIAMVSMTMQTTPRTTNSLAPNFSQVVYSTLAKARPPMMAPEVGVNRFTRPLPAE